KKGFSGDAYSNIMCFSHPPASGTVQKDICIINPILSGLFQKSPDTQGSVPTVRDDK
ncbi:Hypothetical predicted protein, partial [Pelobates cultripes]